MSSKQRLRLEAKINRRMVHSKNGLSTTSWTNWREAVHDLPRHVPPKKEQQEQLEKLEIIPNSTKTSKFLEYHSSLIIQYKIVISHLLKVVNSTIFVHLKTKTTGILCTFFNSIIVWTLTRGCFQKNKARPHEYECSNTLQARIEKKLDEELPQEWMGA